MERAASSEERLEDLASRMDANFARVDERFAQVDANFVRVDADLRELRQTTLQLAAMTMVTMLVGFLGVIATILISA